MRVAVALLVLLCVTYAVGMRTRLTSDSNARRAALPKSKIAHNSRVSPNERPQTTMMTTEEMMTMTATEMMMTMTMMESPIPLIVSSPDLLAMMMMLKMTTDRMETTTTTETTLPLQLEQSPILAQG